MSITMNMNTATPTITEMTDLPGKQHREQTQ